jgi:hypothetical protein
LCIHLERKRERERDRDRDRRSEKREERELVEQAKVIKRARDRGQER